MCNRRLKRALVSSALRQRRGSLRFGRRRRCPLPSPRPLCPLPSRTAIPLPISLLSLRCHATVDPCWASSRWSARICASSCAAPVLFGSRWVGSTGSATSSSGGNFDQLVGTRMYRECMGETGAGLPARQPQPSSAEQHYCGSCSSTAAGGLETSCQDTDTPSTPASVLPRAA